MVPGRDRSYQCHLLITFANGLDSDQVWQNVGLDLDINCLTLMVFLKVDLKKIAGIKNMQNYQVDKELSSALATLLY